MTTSIVMSVYNGSKFLLEQMESIRLQTLQPNEVIILDDCSTDNSVKIIEEYISKYNLQTWILYKNEINKGWKKNFIWLLNKASKDIIFLADQDDVWHIKKLELMTSVLEKNANINVLVSGFKLEKGIIATNNYTIEKKQIIKKRFFDNKFLFVMHPGCAYAVRKTFFSQIEKYWYDDLPHDSLLYRFSLITDSLYEMNSDLIIHRLHNNNASFENFSDIKKDIPYFYTVINSLEKFLSENHNLLSNYKSKKNILKNANLWISLREKFYNTQNIFYFFKLTKFLSFYPKFRTFIKEIFIAYSK